MPANGTRPEPGTPPLLEQVPDSHLTDFPVNVKIVCSVRHLHMIHHLEMSQWASWKGKQIHLRYARMAPF